MALTRTSPPRLRAGSRVRIVAPAGPVPSTLLDAGIAELRSWGLEVSVAEHVADIHPALPYLAGTDADRAADLWRSWCDPQVDAVLCARGGYGCLRVLDLLDWEAMVEAAPKVLAGSSDVTALHHALGARLGVVTLFSPMIATHGFTQDVAAREHLRRCLFEPDTPVIVTGSDAGPLVAGVVRGITVGGNANLLAGMIGGCGGHLPPFGAILLLEDVTEDPYRLDRIFTQLQRAGWLEDIGGIALGSWTDCGDPEQVRAVLTDRFAGLGIPVAWGLDFGHCAGQATIPLGALAELNADAGTLTLIESALV